MRYNLTKRSFIIRKDTVVILYNVVVYLCVYLSIVVYYRAVCLKTIHLTFDNNFLPLTSHCLFWALLHCLPDFIINNHRNHKNRPHMLQDNFWGFTRNTLWKLAVIVIVKFHNYVRWGENRKILISFFKNMIMTEFWKSAYICRSYNQKSSALFVFLRHSVCTLCYCVTNAYDDGIKLILVLSCLILTLCFAFLTFGHSGAQGERPSARKSKTKMVG